MKLVLRYARYAFSTLATIGFGLAYNQADIRGWTEGLAGQGPALVQFVPQKGVP